MITPDKYATTRELILKAAAYPKTEKPSEELEKKVRTQVHQILGGIYLGGATNFAETTFHPCKSFNKDCDLVRTNPLNFHVIMTIVPVWSMAQDLPDLKKINIKELNGEFEKRGVEWLQMGSSLIDDERLWVDFVFNATFPNTYLEYDYDMNKRKEVKLMHLALRALKKREVDS